MPSIIVADFKDFQKAGWNPEKMVDYKALYEQSQVKISQLEQQRVMIREQEMFDNIEKDQSKRLKAVSDKNRKRNDILGAKIEVAKLKKENEKLKKEKKRFIELYQAGKLDTFTLDESGNVVIDDDEESEDEFGCYFDGVKIESITP